MFQCKNSALNSSPDLLAYFRLPDYKLPDHPMVHGFCVGLISTSLTKDRGCWVTSISTT